jgi:hypothetical protein
VTAVSSTRANVEEMWALAPVQGPDFLDYAAAGILRVAALAGLAWLLAFSGRRLAALLLPLAILAPGLLAPMHGDLFGPTLLGGSVDEVYPWPIRLGELATLVVVVLPALLIARPAAVFPVRELLPRLGLPLLGGAAWVAFTIVDPNGPGWAAVPLAAACPLAAAFVVTGRLPRALAVPALLLVVALVQPHVTWEIVSGAGVGDLSGDALQVLFATLAVGGWVLVAPRAGALWRQAFRRQPAVA